MRKLYVASGIALVVLGILIAPLPGPGGIPVMLVGTVVVLKNSPSLRRRWARAAKRWPGFIGPVDNLLRRLRRRGRDQTRPS